MAAIFKHNIFVFTIKIKEAGTYSGKNIKIWQMNGFYFIMEKTTLKK